MSCNCLCSVFHKKIAREARQTPARARGAGGGARVAREGVAREHACALTCMYMYNVHMYMYIHVKRTSTSCLGLLIMDTKTELKSERRIGREGRPAEPSSGRWPFDRDVNLPFEVDSRAQAQHASVVLGKHQHEALGDRDQYQPLAQYSEEHATVGQLDERTDGGRRLEAPGTSQTDVVVEPERVQRLEVSPVRKKPKLDEATNSSFALDESFLEERKGEDGIVRKRVGDHEKIRDLRWVYNTHHQLHMYMRVVLALFPLTLALLFPLCFPPFPSVTLFYHLSFHYPPRMYFTHFNPYGYLLVVPPGTGLRP